MEVFLVDKIELPVGFESHERAIGLWRPDIGELDRLGKVSCEPRHHLDIEGVGSRPPPQFVDVRANEPMQHPSGHGAEDHHSASHGALHYDVHAGQGHEGDDRAQRNREAAGGE